MASLKVFLSLVLLLSVFRAEAGVSPLAFSIVPPVQFPPADFSVTGARLSVVWGEHKNMYGFDFAAIGNMTSQNFGGTAISGIFNYNKGFYSGCFYVITLHRKSLLFIICDINFSVNR